MLQELLEWLEAPWQQAAVSGGGALSFGDEAPLLAALQSRPTAAGVYNANPPLAWRALQLRAAAATLAERKLASCSITSEAAAAGALTGGITRCSAWLGII